MLQVLLMILKILGILILVILGIILTVLLLVLFVPLRYRGDASFDGKPKGNVLVSWLLRFVTVRIDYDGDALKAMVKVLWFKLFDQTLWPSQDTVEAIDETAEDLSDAGLSEVIAETIQEPVTTKDSQPVKKETEPTVQKVPQKPAKPTEDQTVQKPVEIKKSPSISKTVHSEEKAQPKKTTEDHAQKAAVPSTEKPPLMETIYNKIRSLVLKIEEKLRTTYQSIHSKYVAAEDKVEMVRTFLSDPENQKTLHLIKKQIWKLIKHILPRKMRGRIRFGFDDPATTGQILTYISPFYGLYAKSVIVEPVFDEKMIEGELHLKGRIRVGTLLWYVVRVILNKNFRTILKKFLNSRK